MARSQLTRGWGFPVTLALNTTLSPDNERSDRSLCDWEELHSTLIVFFRKQIRHYHIGTIRHLICIISTSLSLTFFPSDTSEIKVRPWMLTLFTSLQCSAYCDRQYSTSPLFYTNSLSETGTCIQQKQQGFSSMEVTNITQTLSQSLFFVRPLSRSQWIYSTCTRGDKLLPNVYTLQQTFTSQRSFC